MQQPRPTKSLLAAPLFVAWSDGAPTALDLLDARLPGPADDEPTCECCGLVRELRAYRIDTGTPRGIGSSLAELCVECAAVEAGPRGDFDADGCDC